MLSDADKQLDAIIAAMTADGQQFALSETDIGGVSHRVFKNAPPSLTSIYAMGAAHAALDFIVYENERYSFADSLARAAALAAALQSDFGASKGDRIIIAMRNYPDWMFAFMAITMIGAVAVPVNAWWRTRELGFAAEDCGAKLAICDGPRAAYLAELPEDKRPKLLTVRVAADARTGAMTFLEEAVYTSGKAPTLVDLAPEDDAMILYTSGSTGFPKGAVSTHRGVVTSLMNFACYGLGVAQQAGQSVAADHAGKQAAALLTIPLFHVTGLVPVSLINFLIGRKLVMMHKWDVLAALELMEREKVTYFVGVPTMSLELLQHPKRADFNLEHLEDLAAGGAPRPADHVRQLKDAFPQSRPGLGYGLTETNAAGAINSRAAYLERPSSTGRITSPVMQIKAAHDDGKTLPANAVGEIWIKSAANVRGYWNRPADTAASFTSDGWFKTGDLGYLDEDGFIYIVDRKKDIIIRGGENVACLEVEDAIFSHPSVAEASVFGLPDERLGEVVGAAVYPKPGESLTAEQLTEYLKERVAGFKVPSHIWLSPQILPKLATGKIDKRSLKAHVGAHFNLT